MAHLTINVVMIRSNGLTTTFTTESWRTFAETALRYADRKDGAPFERVFASAGDRLEEHTIRGLREDLAAGRVPGSEKTPQDPEADTSKG